MFFGLRHESFVGGDDQQDDVDSGSAGQHVAHEPFVPRDVHDARLEVGGERQRRETEIDRNAPPLLLFEAVGIAFVTGSISAPGVVEALEHRLPREHPLRPLFLGQSPADAKPRPEGMGLLQFIQAAKR